MKARFAAAQRPRIEAQYQRLTALKLRHENQLELDLEGSDRPQAIKQHRRDERQRDIDRIFTDYRDWLDNTLATEDRPYLQVIAVFTGQTATEDS